MPKLYITRDGCNDRLAISRDKPKWDDYDKVFDCNKCVFLAEDEIGLLLGKTALPGQGDLICVSLAVEKLSKVAYAEAMP